MVGTSSVPEIAINKIKKKNIFSGGWKKKYLEYVQWEFQDPKMEVPTIYKAYFSGLCKGIYPQNMALYSTNVPPF